MVRRTKADAEVTRHSLLDAAEHLFQAQGVSRTSLAQIAAAAGTSRGAIYWHFKDKAALFNAMMERVTMPIEASMSSAAVQASGLDDPLMAMRACLMLAFGKTVHDAQTRRVFEVATLQVEYNEEMHAARDRRLQVRAAYTDDTAQSMKAAARKIGITIPSREAAVGLHALVDGLIQNWLLDTGAFDLEACGARAVDAYLEGWGLKDCAALAPHRPVPAPASGGAGAMPPEPADWPTPARSRTRTA